jgi:hypothetical protein
MKSIWKAILAGLFCALLIGGGTATAGVTDQEAEQLKTTLTPLGAEKAGNKEGTIPAWDGGYTKPIPGFVNGGKRPDPFADEKPLFSITAKDADKYADNLSEGVKEMLKKYPETFRVEVYPTHRTAAAPQWVYDNTFNNATRGRLEGNSPENVYGGIPFPIPKSGAEAIWNHMLRWRATSIHDDIFGFFFTADGQQVMTSDIRGELTLPYYIEGGSPEQFKKDYKGYYYTTRIKIVGPPLRAGEAAAGRVNLDGKKDETWLYLTGQRRTRKLPNPAYDTPTTGSAGVSFFDEVDVYQGRIDRFDWKIVGKQEMYIPYNCNKSLEPTVKEALDKHHLNPKYVRWELHRVWVIESNLRQGNRHLAPRSRYYLDEDTWTVVLADRWDANGQLWRTLWALPIVCPDIPATTPMGIFGFYDLISGEWFHGGMYNEKSEQYKIVPPYPESTFSAEALSGEGVR